MIRHYNIAILSVTARKLLVLLSGFILLSLLPSQFCLAAEKNEVEKVNGKKYGPEYFFAIEGEVFGQAAPGIESVLVNGKPVPFDENLIFRSKVSLAEGEKYLTIETRYKDLRFIKKYLVVRHPRAQKTFKVEIPKREFEKIIEKKELAEAKEKATTTTTTVRRVARKPTPRPTTPARKPTIKEVLEKASPEVIKVEKPPEKPAAEAPRSWREKFFDWFAQRFGRKRITTEEARMVMERDAKHIIREEAVIIIKRDAPQIIKEESRKFIEKEAPKIVQREARQIIQEKYPDKEMLKLLKSEAPKILQKEVEKVIKRDLPAGEGLKVIKAEIRKIVNKEAPQVLERETRKLLLSKISTAEIIRRIEGKTAQIIERELKLILDKDALWELAKKTVKQEALKAVDKDALSKLADEVVKKEARRIVDEEAARIRAGLREAAVPAKVKPPKIIAPTGEWAGYDLVVELEPGKFYLVKREDGRYLGYLFYLDKRAWLTMNEITYQEFKDLLEKGKLPPSFDTQNKL